MPTDCTLSHLNKCTQAVGFTWWLHIYCVLIKLLPSTAYFKTYNVHVTYISFIEASVYCNFKDCVLKLLSCLSHFGYTAILFMNFLNVVVQQTKIDSYNNLFKHKKNNSYPSFALA